MLETDWRFCFIHFWSGSVTLPFLVCDIYLYLLTLPNLCMEDFCLLSYIEEGFAFLLFALDCSFVIESHAVTEVT